MGLMTFAPEVEAALAAAGAMFPDVPELLLRAVAQTESAGNPAARSPAGAQGLMQFMPATWAEWSLPGESPFDAAASARAAARYLHWLLAQLRGDLGAALAAYNWGIGNVRRAGWPAPGWTERLVDETVEYMLRIVDLLNAAGYRQPRPGPPDELDVSMSYQARASSSAWLLLLLIPVGMAVFSGQRKG